MSSILAVEPVYLWKMCKSPIPEAVRTFQSSSPQILSVNPFARTSGSRPSTYFAIPATIEECLSLTQTIAKLVDKPVQIPVCLTYFRDLADGVQNGGVMFSAKLPANLRQ